MMVCWAGNRKTPTSSENTSPTKATASAMKKTKLGDINLTDEQLKDLLARTSKSSHKHELDKVSTTNWWFGKELTDNRQCRIRKRNISAWWNWRKSMKRECRKWWKWRIAKWSVAKRYYWSVDCCVIAECIFSCCYTWHSQSDYCKMEGHFVYRHTADKRFFKCGGCGSRTICYEKMPTKPCKVCYCGFMYFCLIQKWLDDIHLYNLAM